MNLRRGLLALTFAAAAVVALPSARADQGGGAEAGGYLGAQLERAPGGGLRVVQVPAGGPAATAGVREGDVIVQAQGGSPGSPELFTMSVRAAGAGANYTLLVQRGAARVPIRVHLGSVPRSGVSVGAPPPSLAAQLVMGPGPADLAQLRGRVVLVDFWASWCAPCRMLMPSLNRLEQRFGAQGLTVLGVTDEGAAIARAVGAEMGIGYTLANDPTAAGRFGVRGLPTTVVIDRRGNVRRVGVGVDGQEVRELNQLVQQLLAEPAP
jgi:thiol-disulfide isomerase/thioredoxin